MWPPKAKRHTGYRAIFTTHYLDHPEHGETKVLDGWSYFWGGIGGPVFILFKGFGREALHMLVGTAAIAGVAFLLISFVALVLTRPSHTLVAIVAIIAIALATQGSVAVEILRRGYIRRGYREGYY